MTSVEGRRKTLFGAGEMQMLDIQTRPERLYNRSIHSPYSNQGEDVLPWIEQYTEGDFYLSDYSIGFAEPNDMLMFKLAFRR